MDPCLREAATRDFFDRIRANTSHTPIRTDDFQLYLQSLLEGFAEIISSYISGILSILIPEMIADFCRQQPTSRANRPSSARRQHPIAPYLQLFPAPNPPQSMFPTKSAQ